MIFLKFWAKAWPAKLDELDAELPALLDEALLDSPELEDDDPLSPLLDSSDEGLELSLGVLLLEDEGSLLTLGTSLTPADPPPPLLLPVDAAAAALTVHDPVAVAVLPALSVAVHTNDVADPVVVVVVDCVELLLEKTLVPTPETLSVPEQVQLTTAPTVTEEGEQDTDAVGLLRSIVNVKFCVLFAFPVVSSDKTLIKYLPSA